MNADKSGRSFMIAPRSPIGVYLRSSAFICGQRFDTRAKSKTRKPAWKQRHREDDGGAHAQVPVPGEVAEDRLGLEELLQEREREGADDRAMQAAHAAQD